ncbi:MAG TPA: methylmalonyl-CoA mutase family protein, partial [Acidimicrobiales bacterium]|nr:methylmalonyl-CoA mutase family protein [Acidimicrobiales bacterium]
ALRTQQIIAHETGVANVADPLGGSWLVEQLTDAMEAAAEAIFTHLDELGSGSILDGVYAGVENGYFQSAIADAAYEFERQVNSGRRVVVGVNRFTDGNDDGDLDILQITAEQERQQVKRLQAVRADRNDLDVAAALDRIRTEAADPQRNLVPALIDAVEVYATEGEIMDAMADVFGRYVENPVL